MKATSVAFLIALIATFAIGASFASGVYAAPNWKVKGVFLKKGEVAKVKVKGEEKWKWAGGLTVTCKTTAKEELVGIGENQYNSFLYEGCVVNNPANCKVKEVTALNVGTPKWHTKLLAVGGKFFVEVEKAEIEIVVEGAGCPGALKREIKGNWRYEWVNKGGPIVAEGQKLESNESVTAEGSYSLELESEGTLEVGEEVGGSCSGGTHFVFCNDNQELLTGASVLATGELALFAATLGGLEFKLGCASSDFQATLGALGATTGLLLFLKCKEEKPAGCKLTSADETGIDANFSGITLSQTLETLTGAGPSEEFFIFHVEGAGCAETGTFPVTGKQHVETPKGASSLVDQEMVMKKAGSLFKFGGNSASLSSTMKNVMLSSGLAWLVMAGE